MGNFGFCTYFLQAKVYGLITELTLQNFIPSHRDKFKHGQLMKEEDSLNTHVQTIRMATIYTPTYTGKCRLHG